MPLEHLQQTELLEQEPLVGRHETDRRAIGSAIETARWMNDLVAELRWKDNAIKLYEATQVTYIADIAALEDQNLFLIKTIDAKDLAQNTARDMLQIERDSQRLYQMRAGMAYHKLCAIVSVPGRIAKGSLDSVLDILQGKDVNSPDGQIRQDSTDAKGPGD